MTSIYPEDLTLSADKNMIEQVLINLIRNAIQSFEDQQDKKIEMKAMLMKNRGPLFL